MYVRYIWESLPIKYLSNAYIQECLILEISINNKNGYVVSMYRSPSQTADESNLFINNLEKFVIFLAKKQILYWRLVVLMLNHAIGQLMIPQLQRELSSLLLHLYMEWNNLFQYQLTFCNSLLAA